MPITVNLMENEFFREALTDAHQKGEYTILSKLLEKRFGPLPPEVDERLKNASPETLERWSLAVLNANTLDEVFNGSSTS